MSLFTTENIKQYLPEGHSKTYSHITKLCFTPELQGLRDQLDQWFKEVGENHLQDFNGKFFSKNYSHHSGAFWEMATAQVILIEGLTISRWGDDGEPDIFINNNEIAFEVTSLNPNAEYFAKSDYVHGLNEALNEYELPFPFMMTVSGDFLRNISVKNTAKVILNELGKFTDFEVLFGKNIKYNGLEYHIRPQRNGNEENRASVIHDMSLDNVKSLQGKIKKKKREMNTPYLIVLGNSSHFTYSDFTLESALFGKTGVSFYTDNSKEPESFRDSTGLFPPKRSEGRAINTWISGVLYIEKDVFNGEFILKPSLYVNHWAVNPLPEELFKMKTFKSVNEDKQKVTYSWVNGDNK